MKKRSRKWSVGSQSITRRWLINCLGVTVVVLLILDIVFIASIRSYYYTSVQQRLESEATIISGVLLQLSSNENTNITTEIRSMVQEYDDKDKIELMALTSAGNVPVTSSGFLPEGKEEMPDFIEALNSSSGMGHYNGSTQHNEKVMAVTLQLPVANTEFAAIRLVTSMDRVDQQISMVILSFSVLCLLVILFVCISGVYFLRSIVVPVREVGTAARKIAAGDLEVRVGKKKNDELGELGDIINYMADELTTSNQMKNDFISSVSHELRTPLTAIKGWGETLSAIGPDDHEMLAKGMKVIVNETDRLSIMVEELLDFSRMESGRISMIKSQTDLLAELDEAVLIYEARAEKEDKKIIYHAPENLPYVFGDRNRLRQVFVNVLDNAIKYSDAGDTVTVEAFDNGTQIEIVISDTGLGIDQQDLPRITQKFYKANMSRRGSGIGLAVVDEIIRLHDGRMEIESEREVGTTVRLFFPVMQGRGTGVTEITGPTERGNEFEK